MKTARNDEVNEDTRTDFIMFRAKSHISEINRGH